MVFGPARPVVGPGTVFEPARVSHRQSIMTADRLDELIRGQRLLISCRWLSSTEAALFSSIFPKWRVSGL